MPTTTKYVLFAGERWESKGGLGDFVGVFETPAGSDLTAIRAAALALLQVPTSIYTDPETGAVSRYYVEADWYDIALHADMSRVERGTVDYGSSVFFSVPPAALWPASTQFRFNR